MKTEILKINPRKPNKFSIARAALILKNDGLVAFPTETVYGLGANALSAKAVRKIFKAKKRPINDPLIVHIAEKESLGLYVEVIPPMAKKLISEFWPGPLTLIFKKRPIIPDIVTANLPNVAIRMPDNLVALELIKKSGTPIAAPSANLFGRPSPTEAYHVFEDLNSRIELILDAGKTRIGLESTVLDLTQSPPVLLRPGGLTLEEITSVVNPITLHPSVFSRITTQVINSPGMLSKHYAPHAKVILVEGTKEKCLNKIYQLKLSFEKKNLKTAVILNDQKPETFAKNLFKLFRSLDNKEVKIIIVQSRDSSRLGLAIMNRLRRSASQIIKV